MYVPGIRVDATLIMYTNDYSKFNKKIIGMVLAAGPMWILPSIKNNWGYFILTSLPGITIMGVENESENFSSPLFTFIISTYLGYGYTFGRINVQGLFKYDFINDAQVNFHSIGFSIGLSYIFY